MIRDIIVRLGQQRFFVSVTTLLSGTILAQAITFLGSFALSRLYGPADFGHFAVFTGYASILGAASTLALDRIVLLGSADRDSRRAAAAIIMLSTSGAMIVSTAGVVLWLFGMFPVFSLRADDVVFFIPLFMIFYGGAQIFTYSSLKNNDLRKLASLKIWQSVINLTVQVVISFFKWLPGLIVGYLAGWFILFCAGVRWRLRCGRLDVDFRWKALKRLIGRYWRYPRYVMPNEALDNLSNQMPIFLIGTLYSLSTAGNFGLALMVLSAPAALLGQAVAQVFLQHVGGRDGNPVELRSAMLRIWLGMAAIGIVPFGAIILFGHFIFPIAFGHRWLEAGTIAERLALLIFVRFVSSPTSTIYLKLGLQRQQWWFSLAGAIYRTGAYGLAIFGFGIGTMILVHVAAETVAIVAFNLVALRYLRLGAAKMAI